MPTREQVDTVHQRIEWLTSMSFLREEGQIPQSATDLSLPEWDDLDRSEQEAVLAIDVNWDGFTDAHRDDVIRRVLDGENPESWMDGIEGHSKADREAEQSEAQRLDGLRAYLEDQASPFEEEHFIHDHADSDSGPPPNLGSGEKQIRPLTEQLIRSAMFDTWPGNAAVMDFGIESDLHLGALHHAIRHDEVTPEELDAAMGNGAKLTEIAQRGNNPYRDVSFMTAWDHMPIEPEEPEPSGGQTPPPALGSGEQPIKEPVPIDQEMERVVTELEKTWVPAQPNYAGNARLDNLELTNEENERYLDDVAESYGMSREQMDDYYERLAIGDGPEPSNPAPERPSYDDFLNEATEKAMSRMEGKGRDHER